MTPELLKLQAFRAGANYVVDNAREEAGQIDALDRIIDGIDEEGD